MDQNLTIKIQIVTQKVAVRRKALINSKNNDFSAKPVDNPVNKILIKWGYSGKKCA